MDLPKIKELIELVQETKIAEIEIREGETVVHIKNQVAQPVITYPPSPVCTTGSFYHPAKTHKNQQMISHCYKDMWCIRLWLARFISLHHQALNHLWKLVNVLKSAM